MVPGEFPDTANVQHGIFERHFSLRVPQPQHRRHQARLTQSLSQMLQITVLLCMSCDPQKSASVHSFKHLNCLILMSQVVRGCMSSQRAPAAAGRPPAASAEALLFLFFDLPSEYSADCPCFALCASHRFPPCARFGLPL